MTATQTVDSDLREDVRLPAPGTYTIDPSHSTISAVARHLVVTKVRGRFADFSGEVHVSEDPTASSVSVSIDAASIDTRNDDRDAHLRSPDFLDVEAHPQITFASTKLEPIGGTRFKLTGDLTIKGVTRAVTFDAEFLGNLKDPWGNDRIAFEAKGELDREDWGMTWNVALETGGVLVSRKLTFELEVQAVKA